MADWKHQFEHPLETFSQRAVLPPRAALSTWLKGGRDFTATVTRRQRRRRTKAGEQVIHVRFVVNFREPGTGLRRQLFFERQREAMAARDKLVESVRAGNYRALTSNFTVEMAMAHWLETRKAKVKPNTWRSYKQGVGYIVGPLLLGTAEERRLWAQGRLQRRDLDLKPMLGPIRIADLLTADIRAWHSTLVMHVGAHTANVAKKFLHAALALCAEDFQMRVPPMPTQLGRGTGRAKKLILTPEQVGCLLREAMADELGIYYAFPFLTGVRPSEQLALLWDDIDFETCTITIQRMQETDGSLTSITKTAAGKRALPMPPLLIELLRRWREACPLDQQRLGRVFPGRGRRYTPAGGLINEGLPLTYANFRNNYWKPVFARCGLPYVTPHSARHTFISVLQAGGIEVGLVSKLAGHANSSVTLTHYTQAVRGGGEAVHRLQAMYLGTNPGR